jgi:hypothetical protein
MAQKDTALTLIEAADGIETASSTAALVHLTRGAVRARINSEPSEYRALATELARGWRLEATREPLFTTGPERRLAVAAGRDSTKSSA